MIIRMEKHLLIKGQSLLVLVLLIALILSVVSATSYRLTLETRSTKIQEESVRALAAADNGIEVGMQRASTTNAQTFTFSDLGIAQEGIDPARSRVLITNTSSSEFVSPLIPKDTQYTFYFKDPTNPSAPDLSSDPQIWMRAESGSECNAPARTMPAFEFTYFYLDNSIRRSVLDPCGAGTDQINGDIILFGASQPTAIGDYTFTHVRSLTYPDYPRANLRLVVMRSLFGPSRVAVLGTNLPSQGKEIRSEAYARSGASKVVTVFQSYPQIPSEFFVTTF